MSHLTATYTPPKLPDYLSVTYSLRTIVGVPSDEDVMAIHMVIRAAKIAEQIPSLNDPTLAIQLDQHLFNVQMAVYRNACSPSLFPADAVYTPPNLPPRLHITLEPIMGSPSDEQIMMVRRATRELEKLSQIPSMSDPELSMKLSQHLFNIQLARHIQESGQGRFNSEPSRTSPVAERSAATSRRSAMPYLGDVHDEAGYAGTTGSPDIARNERASSGDTNRLLYNLRNVCVALAAYQVHALQGPGYEGVPLINLKGQVPVKCGLPPLGFPELDDVTQSDFNAPTDGHVRLNNGERITDAQMAAYLRFYEIGADLIANLHGEPMLIPGKEVEAEQLLIKHVYTDPGSGWTFPA